MSASTSVAASTPASAVAAAVQLFANHEQRTALDKIAMYGALKGNRKTQELSNAWLGTQALRSATEITGSVVHGGNRSGRSKTPSMADVLRAKAIHKVAEYCAAHPHASQADMQAAIREAIAGFVVELSAARTKV